MNGIVDLSAQMAAYYPFARKTAKCYIRRFFHLSTQNVLVINAWFLYCEKVMKIKINYFKELVVEDLLCKIINNASSSR